MAATLFNKGTVWSIFVWSRN